MWKIQNIFLTSLCELLGTVALTLYFSAPFNWIPLPPPNATTIQMFVFGHTYHTAIFFRYITATIGNYIVNHL